MNGIISTAQFHLVESIDDLMEMKRWAGERRETPMGVDTESGGLSPWHTRLRTIQLGDKHHGWCVPWDQWGGGALEILKAYKGEFTWHNLSHDAKFMEVKTGWQVPWNRCHDTMIGARIQDPSRPAGLKPLTSRLVDPAALAGQQALDDGMKQQGWTWDTVPLNFRPYWIYAAMDPVLNAYLWEKIIPSVRSSCSEVYDLEMATVRIATKMMLKGMRVDPEYIVRERAKLAEFSERARKWLRSAHGVTSPLSGGQIAKALDRLGHEIDAFTDGGAPKMDKENLERYQKTSSSTQVSELCRYVLAIRHADKMVHTYLDNFLELRDANDIIHCSINTLAAKTGRMSASEPSLQNLPRDDKMIRGSYIPREGNVLTTSDLDQVEMRLTAHFSEDEGLINAFYVADNGGDDFFTTLARDLFNDPSLIKADPRRQVMKNTMYAKAYGASVRKMALTSGAPYEEVDRVNKMLDTQFPGMPNIMRKLIDDAMRMKRDGKKPGVFFDNGRFVPCESGSEYKLLNYRIQGTAAEYLKRAMVNMEAAGIGDLLLLPVHDEILADVPRDDAPEVLRIIQECMTDRTTYRVPVTADGKIMTERWQK